jgi:hypothetical protein
VTSSSPLYFSCVSGHDHILHCKPFVHLTSLKPKIIFRMHTFVTKSIGIVPWKIGDVLSNIMVYKNDIMIGLVYMEALNSSHITIYKLSSRHLQMTHIYELYMP